MEPGQPQPAEGPAPHAHPWGAAPPPKRARAAAGVGGRRRRAADDPCAGLSALGWLAGAEAAAALAAVNERPMVLIGDATW